MMKKYYIWIILGFILMICLWLGSGIFIYYRFEPTEKGTIGDMFGAVNALFSGLAFFGIIISIFIQQKELNLQRKELNDTREEFKINRLTNILFKQIEYLNAKIIDTKFSNGDLDDIMGENGSIDQIIYLLDDYSNSDLLEDEKNGIITSIIESNSNTITQVINIVYSALTSFENLLNDSELMQNEKDQMKRMLSENINIHFFSLLHYKLKNIKKPCPDEDDILKKVKNSIFRIELEKIKYIFSYKKNK